MEESPPILLLPDAAKDEQFKNHPAVVGPPYVRFYAGVPIMWAGMKIGVFCILDVVPHEDLMTLKNIAILQDLAGLVSDAIDEHYKTLQELEHQKAKLLVSGMHNLASPLENGNDVFSEMKMTVDEMKKVLMEYESYKRSNVSSPTNQEQHNLPKQQNAVEPSDDQCVPIPFDEGLAVSSKKRNANDLVLQSFVDLNETKETTAEIDMTTDDRIIQHVTNLTKLIRPSIVSFDQNQSNKSSRSAQVKIFSKRLERLKTSFSGLLTTFKSMLIILSQQIECNIQILLLLTCEELQLSSFIYEMESITMGDIAYYLNTILQSQFPNLHFTWKNDDWKSSNLAMNITWDTLLKILHYTMLSTITSTHHYHQFDMIEEEEDVDETKKPPISTLIMASIENEEQEPISLPYTFPVSDDGKNYQSVMSRLNMQIVHYFDYTLPQNQEEEDNIDQSDMNSEQHSFAFTNVEDLTTKQTRKISNALRKSSSVTAAGVLRNEKNYHSNEKDDDVTSFAAAGGGSKSYQMLIDYDVIEYCKGWMYEEILHGLINTFPTLQGHYSLLDEDDVIALFQQTNQICYREVIVTNSLGTNEEIMTIATPLPYHLLEGFQLEFPCEIFHFLPASTSTSRLMTTVGEYHHTRTLQEKETSSSTKEHTARPRLMKNILLRNNSLKSVHTYRHVPTSPQRSDGSNHSNFNEQALTVQGSSIHRRVSGDSFGRSNKRRVYDFQLLSNFPSLLARTFAVIGSTSVYATHRASVYQQNSLLQEPVCSPIRPKKKKRSSKQHTIALSRNSDQEQSNSMSASSLRHLQRQREQRRVSSSNYQPQQQLISSDTAADVIQSGLKMTVPFVVSNITASVSTRCDSTTFLPVTTPNTTAMQQLSATASSVQHLWHSMMHWLIPQRRTNAPILPVTSSNTSDTFP